MMCGTQGRGGNGEIQRARSGVLMGRRTGSEGKLGKSGCSPLLSLSLPRQLRRSVPVSSIGVSEGQPTEYCLNSPLHARHEFTRPEHYSLAVSQCLPQ